MQVEEFLEQSAARYPEKTALVCPDRRMTYSEVDRTANRLANTLVAAGVRRGDRVVVFLDNSWPAVVAVFGILKAGAVFIPVNPSTKADKLAFILNDLKARGIISHAQKHDVLASCLSGTPDLAVLVLAGSGPAEWKTDTRTVLAFDHVTREDAPSDKPKQNRCIDIDLSALIYTSGTTGEPKGVMLTHLNMVSAATSVITYLENTPEDIILNVLPLSFGYGLYQVLMGFKVGATVVLERSFAYPQAILQRIAQERVTGFPILPTMLAILLQMDLSKHDFSSLRYITSAGAALPVAHIRKLRELFPHVKIYSMYGLTECKRVSYLSPDQIDLRPASVGRGMPNEEAYIVDTEGNRVGPGVVGELVVRGSNVMKGYWGRPEDTDRVLRPGPLPFERVLYTGDLFRMDEEGYLYFVGRKDDIIKSRGEKVSPKEVENVLYQIDGVAEVAVVGVPDDVLGQAVKAIVRPADGVRLNEKDILRHCREHLENFMVPTIVEFRHEFPRTGAGKINKRELAGELG